MTIYDTGNHHETLTDEPPDGTQTSKNTTTSSNTSLAKKTSQPMPYPDHQEWTKGRMTTMSEVSAELGTGAPVGAPMQTRV